MSKTGRSVIQSSDSAGNVHTTAGYRAMAAAPDAEVFEPSGKISTGGLPRKVDMRPLMTKVENQGQTSSCVANAVAGAYEYWIKRITGKSLDVSRLFVYYNARWRAGDQDKDGGSYIQMAMEGLGDFGVCSEPTWPFDKKILKTKPNRSSYQEAADFRVNERLQVPLDLDAWKHCLAEGMPIVFGCVLFESFDQCNQRGGVVPMPSPQEVTRESHGGHSMCCVGYSDVDQVFIVRNSWGTDWGDAGYCYMPYNYLMNPKFNDSDCWVFVPGGDLPLPKDIWVNDDRPVVNRGRGVNFEINPFSIAAYSAISFSFFECLFTEEYYEEVVEEYAEYSEFVESEEWESIEEFSVEEIEEYDETAEADEEIVSEEEEEDDSGNEEEEDDSGDEEEEDDSGDEEEEDDSGDEEEEEDSGDEEEEDDSGDEEEEDDSGDEEEEEDSGDEAEEEDSGDEAEEEDSGDEEQEDDSGDEEEEEDDSGDEEEEQ